jgi:hypothetical protein
MTGAGAAGAGRPDALNAGARAAEHRTTLWVLTALVLLLPILVQAVPLAGVIDAEFGYVAAVVLVAWGMVAGWGCARAAGHRGDGGLGAGALAATGLVLVAYLALAMTGATAWLRQCFPGQGPWVFVLMVLPAPLLGLGTGAVARAWGRTRPRAVLIVLVLALVLFVAPTLVRSAFLQRAPHNLLFGASGLVTVFGHRAFDLLTRPPTLAYRAGAFAVVAFLLALAEVGLRRYRGGAASARERIALVAAGAVVLVFMVTADPFGRRALGRTLAGELRAGAITVRFDSRHLDPLAARRVLDDALWHHQDLAGRMELTRDERSRPLTVWAFTRGEIGRGPVGLSYGNVAAPWIGETVVTVARDGSSATLRHEMVHLLAAPWKGPPFWVPLDSGRTEGLAQALEQGRDRGGPFQRKFAAALAEDALPHASRFLGLRNFWLGGQSVSNSYELAGSFVGFLLERYGVRAVRSWYGGASAPEAFGLSVDELDVAWREHLDEVEVGTADRRIARGQFGPTAPPATHRRRCVRLRPADRAARAEAALFLAAGEERWEEVLRRVDREQAAEGEAVAGFEEARRRRRHVWLAFRALTMLERHEEAAQRVEAEVAKLDEADPDHPFYLSLLLPARLAAGQHEAALEILDRIETLASPGYDVRLWLRPALDSPQRDEAVAVFLERGDADERARRALDLLAGGERFPGFGLWTLSWLDVARGFGAEARTLVSRLLDDETLPAGIRVQLHMRLAGVAEREGRLEAAVAHARAALVDEADAGARMRLADLAERLAWRAGREETHPLPSSL